MEMKNTETTEVVLTVATIRRLLTAGNGDSALLYLCREARLDDALTGFAEPRLKCAASLLQQLGLGKESAFNSGWLNQGERKQDLRRPEENNERSTKIFIEEVQRCIGRKLTNDELRSLLTMREQLGLPADVLGVLIHNSMNRRIGERPSVKMIELEARRWSEQQINTLEKAARYIQGGKIENAALKELYEMMGLTGRRITPAEERYLDAWIKMGFSKDVIRLAYERTCENTGCLTWKYMNSILERWNTQGLYTREQVLVKDRKPTVSKNVNRRAGYIRHDDPPSPGMLEAVRQMLEESDDGV
jgi:DnaD/phage-associated family protein